MAFDLSDLLRNVYNYFLDTCNGANPQGDTITFLAFEKIGHPFSPSDFKVHPTDSAFSPALAVERVSRLVNRIPQISADSFMETGNSVEDTYGMLLLGPRSCTAADPGLSFFATLLQEAQKNFKPTLGSMLGLSPFRPCVPQPVDWFDTSNDGNWTQRTFSESTAQPPPATPPPVPIEFDPKWRLQPSSAQIATVVGSFPIAANLLPAEFRVATPVSLASVATTLPVATGVALTPAMANLTVANVVLDPELSPIERTQIQSAIVDVAPTQEVASPGFSISFKYCLVYVDRPWLYGPFLQSKLWYVPGYKAGDFSTGAAQNNTGMFPAMAVAFLAIRDLQITANWSADDAQAAQNAMSLGPFSLVGSTFQSATLTCKGIQVIGWICQVVPLLPPGTDPAVRIS